MIPLIGQGKPLPEDCPLKGEWLSENLLFLYVPDDLDPADPEKPSFSRGFKLSDGRWCIGFNSELLARKFNISTSNLFAANRDGLLRLSAVFVNLNTKQYVFALGDGSCSIAVGEMQNCGHA